MSTAGFSAFLARKNIKPSAKLYFVDAMSAMAMGLFASLLIGTILDTLGDQFHWDWLVTAAGYAGPVFSLRRGTRLLLSRRPAGVIFCRHRCRRAGQSGQPRN